MTALLVADNDGNDLADATQRALSAVRMLDDDVHILLAGASLSAAEKAAMLQGVTHVLLIGEEASRRPEPVAATIHAIRHGYDVFAAPSTLFGRSVMPRVAALLDVMQVSDIVAVGAPDTFARAIYSGSALVRVRSRDATKVITVRPSAFPPSPGADRPAQIDLIEQPPGAQLSTHLRFEKSAPDGVDLQTARVVVGGGRALGSRESFVEVLSPLADVLGAALAASRAAVDAGYAPGDWQVGQTGKIIAPALYIACGISGAIQHLAGIKDAKTIVAINKDPEAPIFAVADIGIVGDLFDIVPALAASLKSGAS